MQIEVEKHNTPREMMLPMINVVFLLLIFLMLMGKITDSQRHDIDPARSDSTKEGQEGILLTFNKEGGLSYKDISGVEEILNALSLTQPQDTDLEEENKIVIRADKDADLSQLIIIAQKLSASTAMNIKLEVQRR